MTNRFFFDTQGSVAGLVCCSLLILCLGCKQKDQIVRHRIPKERSGLADLRSQVETTIKSPATATDRMIVAIYEFDDATWYFKITGPVDVVKQTETDWKSFLDQLEFVDSKPKWELPDGWSVAAEKPMRFATLNIGQFDPPLELAISSLGPQQDLLLNVNRWRKQMGLEAITDSALPENVGKLDASNESPLLFDVVGNSSGGMGAPFANRPLLGNNRPSSSGLATDTNAAGNQNRVSGLRFDTPDGWQMGRTSSMVPVRLMRTEGDESAQITVINLPAAANEWEPNAKRWAGEIGLTELTADQLKSLTREIDVDGIQGLLIRLFDDEATRATIAGMVKQGNTAWFLKLTGEKDVVVKSEELFSSFLESIEFPEIR